MGHLKLLIALLNAPPTASARHARSLTHVHVGTSSSYCSFINPARQQPDRSYLPWIGYGYWFSRFLIRLYAV